MHYNTYYRKDVWEKFKDEKKKSDLINGLLAEYYGQTPMKPYDMSKAKKTSITKELSSSSIKKEGGVVKNEVEEKTWFGEYDQHGRKMFCDKGHQRYTADKYCVEGCEVLDK